MPLPHYTQNKPASLSDALKWEADPAYSRAGVTVLAGAGSDRVLVVGEVIGKATKAAPIIAADGGNTGDGALGTLTLNEPAKIGVYTAECHTAAANGGIFAVTDPDGHRMADATVAVAYVNPDLNFTIADGAADFVVGDKITITIGAGAGKVEALDPASQLGVATAFGVMGVNVTAEDGGSDEAAVALVRLAIVADGSLVWPAGISAADKAVALAQLAVAGIIDLTEA